MEWQYDTKPARWVLTSGRWRATVDRTIGVRWSARIEHLMEPHERYDGPLCNEPILGRCWCLMKMAELKV